MSAIVLQAMARPVYYAATETATTLASKAAPVVAETAAGIVSKMARPIYYVTTEAAIKLASKAAPTVAEAAPVARKAISNVADLFINLLKRTAVHPETFAGKILPVLKRVEGTDTYKVGKCLHDFIGTATRLAAIPAALIAAGLTIASYAGVLPAGGLAGLAASIGIGTVTGGTIAAGVEAEVLVAGATATSTAGILAAAPPTATASITHSYLLFAHGITTHPLAVGTGIMGTSAYLHSALAIRMAAQERKHAAEITELKDSNKESHAELVKLLSPRSAVNTTPRSRRESGESEEPEARRTGSELSLASASSATNPTTSQTSRADTRVPPLNLARLLTRRASV